MKREYPKHPIAAVGVVVFKGGNVLLIKRNKPPKSFEWSIPGGAQHLGETTKETAARELFEETGITIDQPTLVDVVDYIKKDDQGNIRYQYSLIDYSAVYNGGKITPGDDAIEAKWVPIKDIGLYNLWSETYNLIHKAAANRKIEFV